MVASRLGSLTALLLSPLVSACTGGVGPAPAPNGVVSGDYWEQDPPTGKGDFLDRSAWVVAQIAAHDAGLSARDRAAKLEKMSASPHAFLRGTNHLFWSDFGGDLLLSFYGGVDETRTWLLGDLHAENIGSFDDARGRLVYDLNDFDESLVADYQLDLWRLAISLTLAGRDNGIAADDLDAAVAELCKLYLATLAADMGNDDEDARAFDEAHVTPTVKAFLARRREKDSPAKLLDKWTAVRDGARGFEEHEDLAAVSDALRGALVAGMREYAGRLGDAVRYPVKDVARRVNAGLGSLGTPRFYVLVEGPTTSPDDDLILDVKRQPGPTGVRAYSREERAAWHEAHPEEGARYGHAWARLGTAIDPTLGWLSLPAAAGDDAGSYSVRRISPFKNEIESDDLASAAILKEVAGQWGIIIATAHARADADERFEAAVVEAVNGDEDDFILVVQLVASLYGDQVARDLASLQEAR